MPAEEFGHDARREWTDERGDDPGCSEAGEDRRVQPGRVDTGDDDVEGDRDRSRSEALDESPGDEHGHGERSARDEESDREQHGRRVEGCDRPAAVRPVAGEDHPDHARREWAGEGEGVEVRAVEVLAHDGHDRRDGEGFERAEEDERACPDRDPEQAPAEQPGLCGMPGGGEGLVGSGRRGTKGGSGHSSSLRCASDAVRRPGRFACPGGSPAREVRLPGSLARLTGRAPAGMVGHLARRETCQDTRSGRRSRRAPLFEGMRRGSCVMARFGGGSSQ